MSVWLFVVEWSNDENVDFRCLQMFLPNIDQYQYIFYSYRGLNESCEYFNNLTKSSVNQCISKCASS